MMDEEVVDRFLKTSRKARKQATCYPCQRRKVKCDRGSPCKVCVARGHSFLCSYGRQSDGSVTTPSDTSTTTDSSGTISGDLVSVDASDITVLRKELDKLRHEVHQTRTRHRRCQAAQIEGRRLRARCKEFEATYASLRAGDWTALSRLDKIMDNNLDPDSDTTSPSQSQDDGETLSCANLRVTESSMRGRDMSSRVTQECLPEQSGTSQYTDMEACSQEGQCRSGLGSTSSRMMATGMQSLRLTRDLAKEASTHTALESSGNDEAQGSAQGHHDVTDGIPHTLPPDVVGCAPGPRSMVSKVSNRLPGTSLPISSTDFVGLRPGYRSTAAAIMSKYAEHVPVMPPTAQCPVFVGDPNAMQNLLVPPSMKMFPDSFWIHDTSYPPMTFTQNTDLMERSYADYCSRILVNTLP